MYGDVEDASQALANQVDSSVRSPGVLILPFPLD